MKPQFLKWTFVQLCWELIQQTTYFNGISAANITTKTFSMSEKQRQHVQYAQAITRGQYGAFKESKVQQHYVKCDF